MHVIAAGRASEILDLGDGSVLRRFKAGGNAAREGEIMEHAHSFGYPVPRLIDIVPDGLILERVDGPTMLSNIRRHPSRLPRAARLLAELHNSLHEIPFESQRLLHLDLHPANVLLSRRGPVVIDWTNARAGDPAVDLALTWIIGATSGGLSGRIFTSLFLRHVDRGPARHALAEAAEFRTLDPNVTDDERAAVRRLLRRAR